MDTSTAINACDATVELEDEFGDMVDISGASNEISMEFSRALADFRTFGSSWRKRMACGRDAAFGLKFVYSQDSAEAKRMIQKWFFQYPNAQRELRVYLPNKTDGADTYIAKVLIENFSFTPSADEAGPIMASSDMKPNGAVDWVIFNG